MKKIKLNCAATMEETFADFLTSRKAKGLADKTLQSYEQQFRSLDEMAKQNVLLDICHFRAPFLHNFKLESLIFLTF